MEILQIIVLSVVQGITEFLPISSSAHLILVPLLTGWPDQGMLFDLGAHIGTLFAVLLYFKHETKNLTVGGIQTLCGNWSTKQSKLFRLLVISTLPLIIMAPFVRSWVEDVSRSFLIIGCTSIFYGILLYIADVMASKKEQKNVDSLTKKQALVFGFFQMLSLVPGTSRSGICMIAGRFLGLSRIEATRYALLMSVPVIMLLGAWGVYEYFQYQNVRVGTPFEMALGIFLSFVFALITLNLFMKFIGKMGFVPFVIYRIVLGVVLLSLV